MEIMTMCPMNRLVLLIALLALKGLASFADQDKSELERREKQKRVLAEIEEVHGYVKFDEKRVDRPVVEVDIRQGSWGTGSLGLGSRIDQIVGKLTCFPELESLNVSKSKF